MPQQGKGEFRLLLFVDPLSIASMELAKATLRLARSTGGTRVVGLVDVSGRRPRHARHSRALGARAARSLFNPGDARSISDMPVLGVTRLAGRYGVPLLRPGEETVNGGAFVKYVRDTLRPHAALCLMVTDLFRAPLLAACNLPVNYHNGLLPEYPGVGATEWSIYKGEPASGFTFHLMSDEIDRGPILIRDAVPLDDHSRPAPVERAKTALAARRLPEVMALLRRESHGEPQTTRVHLYTRLELEEIRRVDPATLSWATIQRRLRAFEWLDLELGRGRFGVTAMRLAPAGADHALMFSTADGVEAVPTRVRHLPVPVYRAIRRPPLDCAR